MNDSIISASSSSHLQQTVPLYPQLPEWNSCLGGSHQLRLVFYVVFRFAIVKFDLKTPSREDDDDLEAEKSAVLANNNYLNGILAWADHTSYACGFDLLLIYHTLILDLQSQSCDAVFQRFYIFLAAKSFQNHRSNLCIIVGTKVQFVADEMKKMLK